MTREVLTKHMLSYAALQFKARACLMDKKPPSCVAIKSLGLCQQLVLSSQTASGFNCLIFQMKLMMLARLAPHETAVTGLQP